MNILPKKRWHVRTKDNIARVRRDEAEAREQERQRQEKLQFAESEARINFLRKQSGLPERQATQTENAPNTATTSDTTQKHVDLFADYKSHIKTTNKELEKEKKDEQEKYEKQIGYLTYLGQDTNEALKLRSWYEVAPKRATVGDKETIEKDLKNKYSQDPLTLINALIPPEKTERKADSQCSKRKIEEVVAEKETSTEVQAKRIRIEKKTHKHKKTSKSRKHEKEKRHKRDKRKDKQYKSMNSNSSVEEQIQKKNVMAKLREERLRREASERARQDALLAPKEIEVQQDTKAAVTPRIVQKYNSQFNPEFAKQNMV